MGHGGRNGHLDQKWANIIIDKSMINYLKTLKMVTFIDICLTTKYPSAFI